MNEILLVEDDEDQRVLFASYLEQLGYHKVIAVDSPEFAMKKIKAKLPSIIFLDKELPGMGSEKFVVDLKNDKLTSGIPIFVTSAHNSKAAVKPLLDNGCNGFLQKPYNFKEIVEKLDQFL